MISDQAIPDDVMRLLNTRVKSIWPYSVTWSMHDYERDTIERWCEENCTGEYYINSGAWISKMYFEEEKDAVIAKLKWSGTNA